jgi:AraC-like DNA-binding protein
MKSLSWDEYSRVLRENTLHQEAFKSANDLFLSEYRAFFQDDNLGRIDVSSVQGIGNYTIKSTIASLKDDVNVELKLDEPLFTVGCLFTGAFCFHDGLIEKGLKVSGPAIVIYRQNSDLSYQFIESAKKYETLNISFNDTVLQRILQKFESSSVIIDRLKAEQMLVFRPEDQFLGALFAQLKYLPLDKDIHNLFLAESLVLKILNKTMLLLAGPFAFADGDLNNNQEEESLFQEVIHYVQDNLHKAISINKIAERFDVSPRWLQRHFSNELQMRFSDYLRDLRLARAYDLLTNPANILSIREVCLEVGYNSSQTFSANFKKQYGISPSQIIDRY